MWVLAGGLIKLICLILSKWIEIDKEKREQKKANQKELEDAILKRDTSRINVVIDRLRR